MRDRHLDCQLVVRVPAEWRDALAWLAATEERTVAQEVRMALRAHILLHFGALDGER